VRNLPDLRGARRGQNGAHRLLRDSARTAARSAPVQRPRIPRARRQAVIDLFLDEESQGLALLSDFIGKPISLQAEPSYSQEQYDIVLM
jgi:Ribonuclease G/E